MSQSHCHENHQLLRQEQHPSSSDDVPSSEPNVELATLTLPSHCDSISAGATKNRPRKAAMLHATKDATSAFVSDDAERQAKVGVDGITGTASPCVHIQAVVDLEKLSHLAHATDDEFVLGLHREAKDHTFNPRDSKSNLHLELEKYDEAKQQQQQQQQDEEALPLLSNSIRSAPVSMPSGHNEREARFCTAGNSSFYGCSSGDGAS